MLIKMPVMGKQEVQFWVHAFHLEEEIEQVTKMLNQDVRRKNAFAPIITEYDAGSIHFHILLGPRIDALGLVDGIGKIWLSTNKEHRDVAEKEWGEMCDDVLDNAQKSGKWNETITIDEGKEV